MFVSDKKSPKIVVDSQIKEVEASNEPLASSSSRIGKVKRTKKSFSVSRFMVVVT